MISNTQEEIKFTNAEFGKHTLSCAVTINKIESPKAVKRTRDDDEDEGISRPIKMPKYARLDGLGKKNRTLIMVSEYCEDIFMYLRQRERSMIPTYNYVKDEDCRFHIEADVRSILVDWLVEVHQKFKYVQETLLLALAIMDRFLSQSSVSNAKLQLLAVTSLFIAAKFEEINLPRLSNYAYITDGAATASEIRTAEAYILKCLQFDVSMPNPLNFLASDKVTDEQVLSIAKYILEYMYCCPHFIHLKPSQASALALRLAQEIASTQESPLEKVEKTIQQEYRLLKEEFVKPSTSLSALIAKYEPAGNTKSVHTRVLDWCKNHLDDP